MSASPIVYALVAHLLTKVKESDSEFCENFVALWPVPLQGLARELIGLIADEALTEALRASGHSPEMGDDNG